MNSVSEAVGTLDVALAHAARLLEKDAALAAEQANEILKAVPGHPRARLILGAAHRVAGHTQWALEVLEPLAREQPRSVPVLIELGIARGEGGRVLDSVMVLRTALRLKPDSVDGWRLLADQLDALGDDGGADHARAAYIKSATQDPRLTEAAAALVENNLPVAEVRLRTHLQRYPTDVAALRMLAEVAARLRRYRDAQTLLEQCLQLAPSFDAARQNYVLVLNRQGNAAAALPHVQRLLAKEPRNPAYRNLQAAVLANLGDYSESIEVYEAVLKDFPHQPKIWMSYGHSLKTARRHEDSVAAYRRAIALQPTLGEAYWSLANLKTFRFSAAELETLRRAAASADLSDEDRLHFEFSLGKAQEDAASYEESFAHYAKGNAIRGKLHPYNADANRRFVLRSKARFNADFFANREGGGSAAADPIFIVGMPRAGSTLLEQILASHSLIEGTMELPEIPKIAAQLAGRDPDGPEAPFFDAVAALSPDERRTLGEGYLTATRVHRRSGAPYFIDKMPNNCLYVGLIHLILPNAKIIDARRHPMGCCFSGFKQQFARGQNFSYGLEDLGGYYRDYTELMAHYDAVLPGSVLRVFYEDMIDDTEAQVRRLLEHCGLPFEDDCLRFYDNERAVRTASSEQVRQPIFREGLDHWRHYEPWLRPLQNALGSVLVEYPGVPEFS